MKMTPQKEGAKKLLITAMSFNVILLFFIPLLSADEQTVTITTEVIDSSPYHWLFHEQTKTTVTGVFVTLMTVLVGLIVYYAIKICVLTE